MKERPILFSGDMVRAILYGQKTQTRPVIADKILDRFESVDPDDYGEGMPSYETEDGQLILLSDLCPYGQVGDRLWVRETFTWDDISGKFLYKADNHYDLPYQSKWKPSIHMPRKASRITLEITDIRIERLQDISEEDAIAEGMNPELPRAKFRSLWESINGKGSWNLNPWVWVIEFKQI